MSETYEGSSSCGAIRYQLVAQPITFYACHCTGCATRLFGEPARDPDLFVLRPGTLDDPGTFDPIGYIWTGSARPWVSIPDSGVRCEGQPDDSRPWLRAWRDR
ncbi:MAG: GFA family protein [Deltaproteobacteria bacterium]|nr:GFA family protein [Deltaproteobacteria bacterium]MBW2386417.1 GFA family protein [Deltaproteobacteria bacterium]MBW2696377.1 GFA family protein [Deltaproteobacteria bacterium]